MLDSYKKPLIPQEKQELSENTMSNPDPNQFNSNHAEEAIPEHIKSNGPPYLRLKQVNTGSCMKYASVLQRHRYQKCHIVYTF